MSLALLRTFSTAGLSLVVEKQPLILRHSAEVVQLDIGQADRHERFRLFLGNARNRVDVTATDRAQRQLVLVVDEPVRTRHFLCGRDEAHLFIAQLPRPIANIVDAHEALAPEIPDEYRRGIVRRQGEWFFVPVTATERAELNLVSPRDTRAGGIAEVARIRRHGRQHVATEVYVREPGLRIYARGQVWHPDHKPLSLRGWHRVLLNREPLERIPAVRWCD